ncbi:MAG: AAA family ATPase [Myxococcota bacterium]
MSAHHLAIERTRFLGRVGELKALDEWVRRRERLVTLVGPGGAGKTRLVRELGRAVVSAFPGGVWFCDLANAFTEAELVLEVARAVDLPLEAPGELGARIQAWLRSREQVLLLFDNAEQLNAQARARVRTWLTEAAQAQLVVTSREALGVEGERVVAVGPMSVDDAVALFIDRGGAWDQRVGDPSSAAAVRAVVDRLDRLPLAIELVAARVDLFTVQELEARLARQLETHASAPAAAPARHGTLAATIAWSWALLSEDERRACEDVSVFEGGVALAAATLLWGSEPVAVSRLGALRRKSLLYAVDGPGESRYQLFEAVRAWAREQLSQSGRRAEVELGHARAMTQLCAGWTKELDGPGEPAAMSHLSAERENLLAVVDRTSGVEPSLATVALLALHPLLLARGPIDLHLARLERVIDAVAIEPYHQSARHRLVLARGEVRRLRGQLDGARADFEAVCAWAERTGDARLEGQALRQWALLEGARGHPQDALARSRWALKLARAADDRLLEALSLGALGAAQQSLGRLKRAISAHARALAVLRAVGSPRLVGIELSYLAVATHRLGHLAEAEGLHLEALALDRALGNRRFEAVEKTHLGYLHHEFGRLEEGRASYREALALFREVGDVTLEGVVLTFLGRLEVEAGTREARELLEAALALHRASHHARLESTTLSAIGHLCRDAGDLHGAKDYYQRAHGKSMAAEVGFETLLEAWLGEVEARLGNEEEAKRYLARARDRARTHENPVYALSAELLSGVSTESPARVRALAATSSELRRAVRLSGTTLPAPVAVALTVAKDGTWFSREGGERVELTRRKAVRLILLALTSARVDRPGEALSWEALLAAGWPGERPVTDSGLKRVYTAIWTLRTIGLEGVLITRGDGYLLDPAAAVSWA